MTLRKSMHFNWTGVFCHVIDDALHVTELFVKGTFGKKYTTVSFSAGPLLLARNTLMCSSLLRFFKGTFGNKYTTVSFSAGPLLLARNTLMCSSLLREHQIRLILVLACRSKMLFQNSVITDQYILQFSKL